jgi:hypothetical protein
MAVFVIYSRQYQTGDGSFEGAGILIKNAPHLVKNQAFSLFQTINGGRDLFMALV